MSPEFNLHSGYTWWWIAIAVQIIIIEVLALKREPLGDTLTDHVRWVIMNWPATTAVIFIFLAWLAYHFLIETFQ